MPTNAAVAESASAGGRGTPTSRATSAIRPRFAHSTRPTAAAVTSPATGLVGGAGPPDRASRARSGATSAVRTRAGESGVPANTCAARETSTTGEAHVASVALVVRVVPVVTVATVVLEREAGTFVGGLRKAHVGSVAIKGVQVGNRQSGARFASRVPAGPPGTTGRARAAAT